MGRAKRKAWQVRLDEGQLDDGDGRAGKLKLRVDLYDSIYIYTPLGSVHIYIIIPNLIW